MTAEAMAISRAETILCWSCSRPLGALPTQQTLHSCSGCGVETRCEDGVWRCLSPEEVSRYERFMAEYEFIRDAEGRGSDNAAYYLALPYEDASGKLSEQWRIRARTFHRFERSVVAPLARRRGRALRILDLGAGNGWLSYRVALRGHSPVAVDLLSNERDGLRAATHFSTRLPALFPRVQCTLDRMPFYTGAFDLAVFNASFHYSEDYTKTLAEALRCLCVGGVVAILDTPWYATYESGAKMVDEKHARFKAKYGFASDAVRSQEFLTPERLQELAAAHHLCWRELQPFYGVKWMLRPLRAALMGRRTPSQFRIYAAEKAAAA